MQDKSSTMALLFVLLVALFGILQVDATPDFCDKKTDGYYGHPSNCHRYIQCVHKQTHEMTCAGKLVWNQQHKTCDHPPNADPPCQDQSQSDQIFCKNKTDGNYPDPKNCYGFISCSNNRVHHMDCPANLVWDDSKKRCEYNGDCSDGNPPSYQCNQMPGSDNCCYGKADGNYPDPSNCNGFISCSNGLTYRMQCAPGGPRGPLRWNDNTKRCDWPNNVPVCPKSQCTNVTKQVNQPTGDLCKGKADGSYPNPNNCHGFIKCSNQLLHEFDCPANLLWNDRKKVCDFPQNVYPPCKKGGQAPSFNCSKGNGNNNETFCKGKRDGNYADPNNCYGYISCSNSIVYKMPCPSGLMWRDGEGRCDWPKYAAPQCQKPKKKPCCNDILSKSCCKKIAKHDCGNMIGLYCRKTCNRC